MSDAEERLKLIAAWYVLYRNDEGGGYGNLDGMYEMLGMTQTELSAAYYEKADDVRRIEQERWS